MIDTTSTSGACQTTNLKRLLALHITHKTSLKKIRLAYSGSSWASNHPTAGRDDRAYRLRATTNSGVFEVDTVNDGSMNAMHMHML